MSSNVHLPELYKSYHGEVEFIIRSARTGEVLNHIREHNIIKIPAKEILSHRIGHSKVWDPNGGTGSGEWVANGIDPTEEFAVKYMIFGASFDENGAPLDSSDTRYYQLDTATGTTIPITLGPGAEYDGELINAIPLAEPGRPLKRIESQSFEPTYQPAGSPFLQDDVRALNSRVIFETVLRQDEYNGFGLTDSDFFTITEVALVAGKELDSIGDCECSPKNLFLEGKDDGVAISVNVNGTATITIDSEDVAYVNSIVEGDTIKLVDSEDTSQDDLTVDQVSPYYLVVAKAVGGSDITLDRTPTDSDNEPLSGSYGMFRQTLRVFSHRILKAPAKKSADVEITVRWYISFA